jgi:hypothetical protein
MNLPKTAAGRVELLNQLMQNMNISAAEAIDILNYMEVPEEVRESPLWKALKEE